NLKSKIRSTLRKEAEPKFTWLFANARPLAYAFAALVLGFALAWTWLTFYQNKDQELVAEAISNHARSLMVSHLVDCPSGDQQTATQWSSGRVVYPPPVVDFTPAGYPLVGVGVDILEKRPVAVVVSQRGKQAITLFIGPAPRRKVDLEVQS